jgi:CheY-like chemotaxis protein
MIWGVSLSILLVDDNAVNLKMASLMLKKLGHQTDLATNGIEAIEALQQKPYDIVLMDIQMPEMDGLEATKIIRQRLHNCPKIIIITAFVNYRDVCFEAGADDFLAKPLRIKELKDLIEYHMPITSQICASEMQEFTVAPDP